MNKPVQAGFFLRGEHATQLVADVPRRLGGIQVGCAVAFITLYTSPSELLASPSELLASFSDLSASPSELLASPSELLASPPASS
jgi:hypothetical protein